MEEQERKGYTVALFFVEAAVLALIVGACWTVRQMTTRGEILHGGDDFLAIDSTMTFRARFDDGIVVLRIEADRWATEIAFEDCGTADRLIDVLVQAMPVPFLPTSHEATP